jgi:O-antigen ligase
VAAPALEAVAILVALPWLNPLAAGPSPSVLPFLVSLGCTALMLALAPAARLPRWAGAAFAVFAVFAAWSVARAGAMALEGPAVLAAVACIAAMACLGKAAVDNAVLARVVIAGVLVAGAASAVFGIVQYFGMEQYFAGLVSSAAPGQAFGNLRQRNQFASLMNITLAVLVWACARHRMPSRTEMWALPVAALVGLASGASASRTGLVQLLVLVGLLAAWNGREGAGGWRLLGTAMAAYLAAAILLPLSLPDGAAASVFSRLASDGPECASRLTLWSNVWQLIRERPWAGWGWGELDYAHFVTLYEGPRFCDILDNAHNLPLHLAVELGLPVAFLACALGAACIWRARPLSERNPARQLAWAVVAVILLHSLLEYPLWYGPFQVAFGFSAGLLMARPGGGPSALVSPAVRWTAAACLLAAAAYATWDYRRVSQLYMPPDARAAAYREDTMAKAQQSWLFRSQARFAELTVTDLSRANAVHVHDLALQMLHYSPEPRVVEKLIESATMLGRDDEALFYLVRFRAAFPQEYEKWRTSGALGTAAPKAPGTP